MVRSQWALSTFTQLLLIFSRFPRGDCELLNQHFNQYTNLVEGILLATHLTFTYRGKKYASSDCISPLLYCCFTLSRMRHWDMIKINIHNRDVIFLLNYLIYIWFQRKDCWFAKTDGCELVIFYNRPCLLRSLEMFSKFQSMFSTMTNHKASSFHFSNGQKGLRSSCYFLL